ncbi:PTPRT [Mytilus edulis]|uniref:protein-tyrosine-phosphatase n=1 Tax=Mytilus edulis TaxID=6550 RepID=A0A8S3TML3_MYTED|nr:PTPRT [Mytilus edulis]
MCSKSHSTVIDWNHDDQQTCLGVLCPLPNVTGNLVLLSNKTEYRFGDQIKFDCVGDFEFTSQLAATRECIVDKNTKAAAKHSGAIGPAIGGGIGSAAIVIVVVVIIVVLIRRRTVPHKDKDEMRNKESTLELNSSNIYSQVEERGKDTKTILQFHFTAWPDKDVPKYASSLVHFRHKVNTTRTVGKGPMVVHCSAGVGRTGTFIALDYIVNEAKERDYVEVFRSVEILRNQRVNMVQTANQYLFLHEAVLEALMCPNSGIPCRDFPDIYKNLMRFDNNKKKHKLQIEYELLNFISSRHDEEVFSKGKSEENRGKNRYSNIIPVGSEMPLLSTGVDGHNEYINAVFLPKSSNVYWPEGNKDVTFGPFNITRTHISTQNLYTCLDLTYKYKNQESKQVKLFQSKFWEENMINPVSANDMLSFLSATEDELSNNRGCGPVLVHCLNGCDKSGLYCVLATVIERLRIEQDVDIQHIIKQMRNRRPQIIPNYEQFQFIYEAVIEYLKEFETYSNFQ